MRTRLSHPKSARHRAVLPLAVIVIFYLFPSTSLAKEPTAATSDLFGLVSDPQGAAVADASVALFPTGRQVALVTTTDLQGRFEFHGLMSGPCRLTVEAPGFIAVSISVNLVAGESAERDVQFRQLASQTQQINVVASEPAALAPDPSQLTVVHDEALDANPGRPGTPISIPGLPIETASGGIKAPQYFAPGVAGDHGEPIAQFFQVGDFLFPNNLPANAHGNGYADPNPLISQGIGAVQVDGGAFNVREGNHAVNLAAAYLPRPRVEPFIQLTGDHRDIDVASGWSPSNPNTNAWIGIEAAYGNGYLNRLEHRRQFKLNAYRSIKSGRHDVTLFGIGYYGFSDIPGLVPRDVLVPGDTIDPRQSDRTHTAIFVATDSWQITGRQQMQLSVFFRTYNLQLRSNFGDGLIQQSEFRTVVGGNTSYLHKFRPEISVLAGFDLRRDAPRGLDLKRADTSGQFQPITSNDLTLGFAGPYLSLDGGLTRYFHYDLGVRREEVFFDNLDNIVVANSFNRQAGLTLPKGTFTILPNAGSFWPRVSFSFGEAFHTNDPRIGQGNASGTMLIPSHAAQLLVQKEILKTDFRITLARVTNDQELAKIDPDTGLQQDVGPSIIRSITVSACRSSSFGYLLASFARATAVDRLTGAETPEAPRLIWDLIGGTNHLPLRLRARGEFEYVGRKPLDAGFTADPVREIRGTLFRSFNEGRFDAGLNFLLAHGFTGQTVEPLRLAGEPSAFPRVVGVRLKSYVGLSLTYHLSRNRGSFL